MVTVKKYSNRRLYDTSESRYVTLEESPPRFAPARRRAWSTPRRGRT